MAGDMRLLTTSPRPIFTLKDKYLESGAVGGYFASKEEIVQKTVSEFKRILAGEDSRNIPFYYVKEKFPVVKYPQLISDGFSVDSCPEETVFIDKPQSFWERYVLEIFIGGVLLVIILLHWCLLFYTNVTRWLSWPHVTKRWTICQYLS